MRVPIARNFCTHVMEQATSMRIGQLPNASVRSMAIYYARYTIQDRLVYRQINTTIMRERRMGRCLLPHSLLLFHVPI